jgi:biotin-(acetyl-CoA carboxylase) ligase
VLCEARWQGSVLAWVVVGIGINVTNRMTDLDQPAANLAAVQDRVTVEQLVVPITAALLALPADPTLNGRELSSFHSRDWLLGKTLTEPVPGIARGIGPDGALLVERPDTTTTSVRAGRILLG